MCLAVLIQRPSALLEEGTLSSEFEYAITHNTRGHRCGYLKLLPGHPWHGVGYSDLHDLIDVHGGLNFADPDVRCDKAGDDDGWWIGFDCAHFGDACDWDLALESHRQDFKSMPYAFSFFDQGVIRTTEYVRDQLEYLGKQAAEAIALVSR